MLNRRIVPAALALLLIVPAILAAPATEDSSWDKPDKKWRLGPVKYLLTKDEDKEYKGLETDEARARFVQSFWERRDPTAGTPENEYRDAFYTNAREATARFAEDGGKGWQDDRGKIYILLGPPDDMSEQEGLLSESGGMQIPSAAGGYGSSSTDTPLSTQGQTKTVKFIYLTNPFGAPGRLELTFKNDVTGGFRLQDKVDWDAPIMRGLATPPPRQAAAAAAPAAAVAAPAIPETAVAPPAPPPPPPTPQAELMEQVRAAAAGNATVPLGLNINYYKARDDSTSATLTLELPADAVPAGTDPNSLIVTAEFLDATGQSAQRFFNQEQFGFLETGAKEKKLVFQSQRSFNPGKYKAYVAVKDPASGALGVLEKEVEVPVFSGDALGLSTVTLVHKLERLSTAPATETPQPFILGSFKVVPRSSARFLHGEELIFYYQVYGATADAGTGKPKLDITYAFEMKQQDKWKMVGREPVKFQGQEAPVQAYGLPINPRFPGGDYRVRIEVSDAVSGTKTTAEIPFTVDAPEKTSQAK